MEKNFFIIGSILGGIAVATGAFGAHGLKNLVSAEALETWDKAVRYQMYHALALLLLAWAISHWPAQARLLGIGGWLFLAGVLLFSGSLYLLVLSGIKWLGAITPLGGVAFVAGWLCLLIAAWRS
ncbi:MAG: DUF423 domain-containing protein [Anaerolineales bacterium]|nr:DUF423 domain-containing protein [Anaerolineales bacterium]